MAVSLDSRRKVGRTTLELPVCGLGTAHLGELYGYVDEAISRSTLETAWNSGMRFFDTAPWYGRGLAEHRLGGFLRTLPRSDFLISTKVGRTLHRPKDPATFDRGPWAGGLNFEVRFDYSYDGIMRSYEQALQRLALDTVDALVIHDLDAAYHQPAETYLGHRRALASSGMKALQELKAAGDIGAYGMGINTNEAFETVAPEVDLDFLLVAMPYTLLDQDSLHRGMAECLRRNVSVIIGAPYASGILATGASERASYGYAAAPKAIQDKARRLQDMASAHGIALQAAALQFPLAHPAVVSIIPGAARPEEVAQNVRHLATTVPQAFWSDLKAQGLLNPDAPVPGGGA
ncbi:aldo/keto reductase [Palleronia sp. KMU-117]|uniref:aldo/keto reductase n=1 Tax=Palleronia sp. KMU-117 TaxID=3434108 RepID=UPI003D727563